MPEPAQPLLPMFDEEPPAAAEGPARTAVGQKGVPSAASGSADDHRAARQVFLGLTARWSLSAQEALTLLGEPTAGEKERRERLRDLAGINGLLQVLLPERERQLRFLRRPAPSFGGRAPLLFMLAGGRPAIARVRAYLAKRAADGV